MSNESIKNEIRQYLKESIVQDESMIIDDNTPLISGGLMDSISTLKMVGYIEQKYGIEFQPHEVDRENLETLELITNFIGSKL